MRSVMCFWRGKVNWAAPCKATGTGNSSQITQGVLKTQCQNQTRETQKIGMQVKITNDFMCCCKFPFQNEVRLFVEQRKLAGYFSFQLAQHQKPWFVVIAFESLPRVQPVECFTRFSLMGIFFFFYWTSIACFTSPQSTWTQMSGFLEVSFDHNCRYFIGNTCLGIFCWTEH